MIPRILPAAACCLCLSPCARAGDAIVNAGLVPAEVDLFVSIDDAAAWRRGPGGDVLHRALLALSQQGELSRAWSALARTLGLEGEPAFDALLGSNAVFVQRQAKAPGASNAWALLSTIDPATERLIRERLKPAPRLVQGGLRVLALEDGRFWLASSAGARSSTILLAAADAPALFDEMIPALNGMLKSSLAASKYGEDLRSIHAGADAIMLARRRDEKGRLVVFGVGASRTDDGCAVGLLARAEPLAEALSGIAPSPPQRLGELRRDALLVESGWRVPGFYDALGFAGAESMLPVFLRHFEGKESITPRSAIALWTDPDGSIRGAVALETSDRTALAPPADRFIAGMFKDAVPDEAGAWVDASVLDLKGEFPEAVREIAPANTMLTTSGLPWPKGVAFSWAIVGPIAEQRAESGWWILGTGVPAVERLIGSLRAAEFRAGEPRPTFSTGLIRPAALWTALEDSGVPMGVFMPDAQVAVRRVQLVEWTLFRGDGGSLRGSVTVSFAPGAPAR